MRKPMSHLTLLTFLASFRHCFGFGAHLLQLMWVSAPIDITSVT